MNFFKKLKTKKVIKDFFTKLRESRSIYYEVFEENGMYTINTSGSVYFQNAPLELQKKFSTLLNNRVVKFGTVKGHLIAKEQGLTNIRWAPEVVEGDFDVANNDIKSLEGGPKEVRGDYNITNNPDLTSLKGTPESVRYLYAEKCSISDISDLPKRMTSIFLDYYGENLIGMPNNITFSIVLNLSDNFKSFEGLNINGSSLLKVTGCPEYLSNIDSLMLDSSYWLSEEEKGFFPSIFINDRKYSDKEIIDHLELQSRALSESLSHNDQSLLMF